jgi:hypothetical protein
MNIKDLAIRLFIAYLKQGKQPNIVDCFNEAVILLREVHRLESEAWKKEENKL